MLGNQLRYSKCCWFLLMLGIWTVMFPLMFCRDCFSSTPSSESLDVPKIPEVVPSVNTSHSETSLADLQSTTPLATGNTMKVKHHSLSLSQKLWNESAAATDHLPMQMVANNNNNNNNIRAASNDESDDWRPLPPYYFKTPFPIFVASLPKSGTTSIHSFFMCGKVRSVHHFCPGGVRLGPMMARNIQNHTPPFQGCERLDDQLQEMGPVNVFTDTGYVLPSVGPCYYPSVSSLDDIYQAYPNMTIVLGTRNSSKWFQSILSWGKGGLVKRWIKFCPFLQQNQTSPITNVNETLINFYEWHSQHIRNFAQSHPSITFVEFQIDSPNAGKELEQQTNISSDCWGHSKPIDTRRHPHNRTKIVQKRKEQSR